MSFLPINQDNDEAPQGQTTNSPQAEAPPASGGSVGEGGAGAPAKGSAVGTPTQFGSSASKLGDYLSANNPQIQGQADTLVGELNTQYGDIDQGITSAANQFNQSVQGGYAAPNQGVVDQAFADPTQFASDPNNVAAFQSQYNNQYTGPQNFEGTGGYADIQDKVGKAVTQGNLLGSQAGLQSYLQGKGNNPTQAMSTLDSILLRGNQDAQDRINTAAGQFGDLTGKLGASTTSANQSAQDAQKAAQQSKDYAQQKFTDYGSNLGSTLTNQLGQNQSQYDTRSSDLSKIQSLMGSPTGGSLTPQQAAALGLQPGQFEHIQAINNVGLGINFPNFNPVNPGNFYTQNQQQANAPTLGSSATPEQIAQMKALEQLSGGAYQEPFDLNQTQSQFALPGYGNFNYGGAKDAGLKNLQNAYDFNYQNIAGINDPIMASKMQSVLAYLNSQPGYETYAPPPQSPPLQPPNPPPAGGGGRATR